MGILPYVHNHLHLPAVVEDFDELTRFVILIVHEIINGEVGWVSNEREDLKEGGESTDDARKYVMDGQLDGETDET